MELVEAPHTANNTSKGREQEEKENDAKSEIYNYILKEKWTI